MTKNKRKAPEITDEEEARIQAGIAKDPDAAELTDEQLAAMRPASEVLPPALYAALTRPRGRPKAEVTKVPVKLRLDPNVVSEFKATGAGWQTRMNAFLSKNVVILQMIGDYETDICEMDKLVSLFDRGELKAVHESAEQSIARIRAHVGVNREVVRTLREQLDWR